MKWSGFQAERNDRPIGKTGQIDGKDRKNLWRKPQSGFQRYM